MRNACKHATLLGKHLLQHHLRASDHDRIVLASYRQVDLPLFEPLQDVRELDTLVPDVFNAPYGFLFPNVEGDNLSFFTVRHHHANVVEEAGVPKGVKIAAERGLIVNVTWLGKYPRPERCAPYAAVPAKDDFLDNSWIGGVACGRLLGWGLGLQGGKE